MLPFSGTMDENVVSNVPHIVASFEDLPNYMFAYLRGYWCSIWQAFVTAEADVCFECCQVTRWFSQFDLVITFFEINFGKEVEPVRSCRISSDVGCGWCVRRRASLGLHMLTHSLTSPFGLSTMTTMVSDLWPVQWYLDLPAVWAWLPPWQDSVRV